MDQMTTVTELEREHTPELPDHVQLLTPASLVGNAGLLPPNVHVREKYKINSIKF